MTVARNGKRKIDEKHPVVIFLRMFPDASDKIAAFYTGYRPGGVREVRQQAGLLKQPRPPLIGRPNSRKKRCYERT